MAHWTDTLHGSGEGPRLSEFETAPPGRSPPPKTVKEKIRAVQMQKRRRELAAGNAADLRDQPETGDHR